MLLGVVGVGFAITVNPASSVTADSAATPLTIPYRDANGSFAMIAGDIDTAKIAAGAVDTTKIAPASIDTSKISKASAGSGALCELNDGSGKFGHCTNSSAVTCTCQ